MEHLYTYTRDRLPRLSERHFDYLAWYSINAECAAVPLDAAKYWGENRPSPQDMPLGPAGNYLELDWGMQADRISLENVWDGYIPIDFPRTTVGVFYHHLDDAVGHTLSEEGDYVLRPEFKEEVIREMSKLESCMKEIGDHRPFEPGSPLPESYDYGQLDVVSRDHWEVEKVGATAKRNALRILGFLNWWTTSVVGWEAHVSGWARNLISSLKLGDRRKRGYLVNLVQDWPFMNIPLWLEHQVPFFYVWGEAEDQDDRFLRLNPRVIRSYLAFCNEREGRPIPTADLSHVDFAGEFHKLAWYDELLQRVSVIAEDAPLPPLRDQPGWSFFCVDFEGWKRRPVSREQVGLLRQTVSYSIFPLANDTIHVVFLRWKKRSGAGLKEHHGLESSTLREVFKALYAPKPGQKFDVNSGLESGSEEADQASYSAYLDFPIDEGDALIEGVDVPPATPPPEDAVPRPNPETDPILARAPRGPRRRGYDSYRPGARYTSDWVSSMADDSRQGGRRVTRSQSPARQPLRNSDDRPRNFPEEPRIGPNPLRDSQRRNFLRDLQSFGEPLTATSGVIPVGLDCSWNPELINCGYLIVPDPATEFRMRYWVACYGGVRFIRQVLTKAIEHGLQFSIGVKAEDFPRFRPTVIDKVDRRLTKFLYAQGYKEPALPNGLPDVELRDLWKARIAGFFRRPHAPAVVGMGGPHLFVALRFGGDDLIQRFMQGPSIQTTTHNGGAIDSTEQESQYVQWDTLSKDEANLVLGYASNGDRDTEPRWLFPPLEILTAHCKHWSGEWNVGTNKIFEYIARDIDSNSVLARTKGEWRKFLHSNNHGLFGPVNKIPRDQFFKGKELLREGFPVSWDKAKLTNIEIPERYVQPTSEN